jgi:ring-1,2-phenylacetyl-CoA epoxidase subunit PaaB
MWVVPAKMILTKTAQELEDETWLEEAAGLEAEAGPEPYYVCHKQSQKPSDTYVVHVGQVEATTSLQALRRAQEAFADRIPWVWWVFPARAVTRSEPDDIESMFEPALDKHYRHQYHYHTVAEMRKIKKQQK